MLRLEIMEEFFKSWKYLNNLEIVHHDEMGYFSRCLSMQVVKENPATHSVDEDTMLNTKVQVWLEFGGIEFSEEMGRLVPIHDTDLDCGADTFEEAIIELAKLCRRKGLKEHVYREVTAEEIAWLESKIKPHK